MHQVCIQKPLVREKPKGRKDVSFKYFARAPRRAVREKAREAWLIPERGIPATPKLDRMVVLK